MRYVPGKIISRLSVKNMEVIFRFPKPDEAKELMKFYNKVIKETSYLTNFKRISLKSEKKWLNTMLNKMREKDAILIVVETNGKIIGNCVVKKEYGDSQKHIGSFGIAIAQEFTHLGIGTRLAMIAFKMARAIGIEIIRSSYFSKNKQSEKFHKKLGFVVIGKLPKGRKRGKTYDDEVIVYKNLVGGKK